MSSCRSPKPSPVNRTCEHIFNLCNQPPGLKSEMPLYRRFAPLLAGRIVTVESTYTAAPTRDRYSVTL